MAQQKKPRRVPGTAAPQPKRTLRTLKHVVQTVCLVEDEKGDVVGELTVDPYVAYGTDELKRFAAEFERKLAQTPIPETGQ